jgi:hypothetical protein
MSGLLPATAGPVQARPAGGSVRAMSEELVVLRGGSRDGESTTVQEGVRRLLAASAAPGLIDVYEANGETSTVEGNPGDALVFIHAGQQPAGDAAPEMLHPPQQPNP